MMQSTKSISPLRQRMIDDMTLRKLSPKTQIAYIRAVKNFTRFYGRSPDTAEGTGCLAGQFERTNHRFKILLRSDGRSPRGDEEDAPRLRAAQVARSIERGRGDPTAAIRRESQVPSRIGRGVWGRPACQRGRSPQGARHRQRTHGAARRTGQRQKRPLRHALAGAAAAVARLVAPGPGAAQTAPRRLAVSGPEPSEPDVHPATQP